jgi:hypothetical protein
MIITTKLQFTQHKQEGAYVMYIKNTQRTSFTSFPDDGGRERASKTLEYSAIFMQLIA